MDETIFDGAALRKLLEKSGATITTVANGTGLSCAAIETYMQGRSVPRLNAVVALADYFAVPLDVLCGRCSPEDYAEVMEDFPANFAKLARRSFENYVSTRAARPHIPGLEAPWPYNLIDEIIGEPFPDMITPDQETGLFEAVVTLSERQMRVLLLYYRDGLTLDEIVGMEGVSRERIRQIIAKAVRMLRHPSRKNLILRGAELSRRESEYEKRNSRLCALEAEADEREEKLRDRFAALETLEPDTEAKLRAAAKVETADVMTTPLDELELSVRSYNCLARADVKSVAGIVALWRSGEIRHVRNLGRRSLEEIGAKLREMGVGIDD